MISHIKNNWRLLRRAYRQLIILWLVYIVMTVACAFFITNVARGFLDKNSQNVLAELQSKVVSDLLESETSLRSATLHIQYLMRNGDGAVEIFNYIREFTGYVLNENRRITGVKGIYGAFKTFDGDVYIDGSGIAPVRPPHLSSLWYRTAIDARGNIAITSPYFDDIADEWKITFSRSLYDNNGNQIAVVALDMHLAVLRKYFNATYLAQGGYGILIDEELNIVAASAPETIGRPLSDLKSPHIYAIIAELNKGSDISGYRTVNNREGGEPVMVYSRKLENGWRVGILTPTRKYFREVYERGMSIVVFGLVLHLALSLIVLRVAAAKQKAEEKSAQKSNFLASMSHEIRTPMNAIIGFAELALREDVPPAAFEHIFTIKQAGANLLTIINNILDFSKIESGKLEIVDVDYFFSSLVNDVVSIIKMRATYSRIRFIVNIDCNIPNALFGDETRVRQVLLNLLSNAVKYTEKGFVALSITGTVNDDGTLVLNIEVADSGKGIKQEDQKELFKDFVRVDKARNRGIEGTGLGLAITNSFLKAMGGSISVESEYGKGSTFKVVLPQKYNSPDKHAHIEDQAHKNVLVYERREIYAESIAIALLNLGVNCTLVESESEFEEKASGEQFHFIFTSPALYERTKRIVDKCGVDAQIVLLTEFGDAVTDYKDVTFLSAPAYSIVVANVLNGVTDIFDYGVKKQSYARFIAPEANVLLVDDTSTNLRVAEGLLAPYKMRLTLCKGGAEAIELVKSEKFDVVFMDHMMPGVDGVEATKRIRSMGGAYRKLPIVALTANAVSGAREMFLSEGFSDFISKPIELAKLNAALDKWIPVEKRKSPTEINGKQGSDDSDGEMDFGKIFIDGVNIINGIALSGGNGTNYLRALAMFYEDGFEKVKTIKQCLETDDLQLYATHVHGLKSAAASIGADQLSESTALLETAGKENNRVYINEHTPKFFIELEALLSNIGLVLNELKSERSVNITSVDIDTLTLELVKLKDALDSFDSEGIDRAVSVLEDYDDAIDYGTDVKAILQGVLIGEYDDALVLINEMLVRLGEVEPG